MRTASRFRSRRHGRMFESPYLRTALCDCAAVLGHVLRPAAFCAECCAACCVACCAAVCRHLSRLGRPLAAYVVRTPIGVA